MPDQGLLVTEDACGSNIPKPGSVAEVESEVDNWSSGGLL